MKDPYVYEGTSVLKNNFNIRDEYKLNQLERMITEKRTRELSNKITTKKFNFEYLKSIHKYIFQDIYEWAGEIRHLDIAKGNSLFCKATNIESYASDIFKNLEKQNYLKNIKNKEVFCQKLAEIVLDINALHPFREGNGRTQREFIRSLAKESGYELSFLNISKDEMIKFSDLTSSGKEIAEKFLESIKELNKDRRKIPKKKKSKESENER